jgi:hypothetical protein
MGVLSLLLGLVISLAGPQQVSREETAQATSNARKQALGGFEISHIMVHDLLIPIPSFSDYRREGRNPEIVRIDVQGSTDALHSFFLTAMPQFKWKPMGPFGGGRPCWTQVHPKYTSIETVCVNATDGKVTLTVRSETDAK